MVRALAWLVLLGAPTISAHAQLPPISDPPPGALSATAFPSSDAVTREYPSDAERLAALAVLLDLLQFKTDDRSALALQRQTDYRRTIARLDPPRATDDQRAVARTLRSDVSFQNAVVTEFLPAYATEAARAAATPRPVVAPAQDGTQALWTALAAALVAALLLPVVAGFRKRR